MTTVTSASMRQTPAAPVVGWPAWGPSRVLTVGIRSDTADLNEGLVYFLTGNVDITARRDLVSLPGAPQAIPEPATLTLLGTGLLGLLGAAMRRR